MDPVFPPQAYILAHDLLSYIGQNMAIQFQLEGPQWPRETMVKHVADRQALLRAQAILLDAGEMAAGIIHPKTPQSSVPSPKS